MTKSQPERPIDAHIPVSSEAAVAAPGHNSNAFFLGPRRLEIWPGDQSIAAIDRGIYMTRFADIESYHGALQTRILEEEQRLRQEAPAASRCLGGQKVRRLHGWNLPEFELLNARAKEFFRRALGSETAVVDACWGNVYRQWESIGPHSHRRATASLVYCLDAGDKDEDCHLSGLFSIVDPRLDICCQMEKGHMTNPFYPDLTTGTLLIFPGKVVHAVNAYSGTTPRITLSWNINPAALPGSLGEAINAPAHKPE